VGEGLPPRRREACCAAWLVCAAAVQNALSWLFYIATRLVTQHFSTQTRELVGDFELL